MPPEVASELDRVLAARPFIQAHRLRKLLRFIVETSLRGGAQALNEYLIGMEVYGRGSSFDPRLDAIVRVDATRLRAKLSEYYAGEGSNYPWRIELPRGYSPVFRRDVKPAFQSQAQPHDLQVESLRRELAAASSLRYISSYDLALTF